MFPEDARLSSNTRLVVLSMGEATVKTAGNQRCLGMKSLIFSQYCQLTQTGNKVSRVSCVRGTAQREWLGSG